MAGVVAMASIIEDFDTQPCKKSCKDGGSPVVKTITNYFSPVPKPAEKPFSPPRSNNIMDYFSRKPPSAKEKSGSPEQSKENCNTEKHRVREATVKPPPQKRRRKASKAARKLVEAESSTPEFMIVEEQPESIGGSAAEDISSCGVLGSDTAALLVQLSAEASENNSSETLSERDGLNPEAGLKQGESIKLQTELNCINLSPIAPLKEKAKQGKSLKNPRKKLQQEAKPADPVEKEKDVSLCDVSMEVNVDEASRLNSTVTISFEDFVRSQDEDEEDRGDDGKITTEAEEMETEQVDVAEAEEKQSSAEPPLQVSPRTLTIQAEVHAVSPKQEAPKAAGKVASIFNRRKGVISPANVAPPPHIEAAKQPSSPSMAVKRKSNVVLQEEDLELAVLESESTPKCSEAEKKQFMAAFKQPSLDGSKTKSVKSQGKQKQAGEKVVEDAEKMAEEEGEGQASVQKEPAASEENKPAKRKPAGKGRKKAKGGKEAVKAPVAPASVEEVDTATVESDDKKEEVPMTSTPSIPAVRRSRREAVLRQIPEAAPATPLRKTRSRNESKDTPAAAALPGDSPADLKTPKRRKSRHGVFVAEMLCPPDMKQSPIRIKFRRVHNNVSTTAAESRGGTNSPVAAKASNESKKRKQAKKLVEKAKVIQQSKNAATKDKSNLRRSSRAEASLKKSYCEDEDSVICLEEDQLVPEKTKTLKSLRSLNDVLGKAAAAGKDTKAAPGSKASSLVLDKSARKASAVISIFDDSSREGSDNTQDDEQFRARREFLKSGLPESFRKQIAKTAATKEAYSLSCSSFQPVIHIKQQTNDCPLWSLLWPESSLLCCLKEFWCQSSSPPPFVGGPLCVKTKPVCRASCEGGSGWRPEISESVRQLLLEEIRSSNPAFLVQKFFTCFLKRRSDHHQQQQQSITSDPEAVTKVPTAALPSEPTGGKRKRTDDEAETTTKVAKKQRANSSEDSISTFEPTKRGGRSKRGRRSRQEAEEEVTEKAKPSVTAAEDDSVVVLDDEPSGEDADKKDVSREDVLWTDKYQPQHSSDIVGNHASVKRLHSWLKEWKLRADREERKKLKEKKQEEGSNDSDWECGEEDSQDGEDMLCNTILITGPTGVGKTAAVYACAQELGFKVFEVNASSQRSGRLILSQLKEATQSHQVDSQGVNAHKPTYFNSYGTSSSGGTLRPGSSPRKLNSPRRVVSSPRKHPQSPRGAKRGGLAPTSLANFFKMGRPTSKETSNTKKNEQTAASKKITKANESKQTDPAVKSPKATTPKEKTSEEQSKKTATSLILFEEVDVIFDDDSGFLAAIKTFMTTTKRPVILTTSDPAFSAMFDGNFEEIIFKTPSVVDVSSFLRLLCLTEDMRTDQSDVSSLLRLNSCDIRQSLLQLQFWSRSGGGGSSVTKPLTQTGENAELKPEMVEAAAADTLPPCDQGCTESMLGLPNAEPHRDFWEMLKSHSPVEEESCWELLRNSRRRGVDLLYSNMETLLPLPHTQLTTSTYKLEPPVSASQDPPSHTRLLQESADFSDDSSPVKMSSRMRKNKRRNCLPEQDGPPPDSDSEDGFVSLSKPKDAAPLKEDVIKSSAPETVKRKPLTPEERLRSLPVSQCLESIAGFLDNMSFMDSSLIGLSEISDSGWTRTQTGTVLKDGMTDEPRIETERQSRERGELVLEIPAAVEALSFQKCRVSVADVWDEVQKLEGKVRQAAAAELSLPVAAHREGYSFSQDGVSQPQLVQRRREVMETLLSRGAFGSIANRPAAALDYLPALRNICRSEQLKEQGKVKRRFLHYLDAISLGLDKSMLQHLAEDFP